MRRVTLNGVLTTLAALPNRPVWLAADSSGPSCVTMTNSLLSQPTAFIRITADGVVTPLVGNVREGGLEGGLDSLTSIDLSNIVEVIVHLPADFQHK